MQQRDPLTRQEEAAPELVTALRQLSPEVQASPAFLSRVLAQAAQRPMPRPRRLAWLWHGAPWRLPPGVAAAALAVFVLAVVGAVPQYITWVHTAIRGEAPDRDDWPGPLLTRGGGPPRGAAGLTLPLGPWHLHSNGQRSQLRLTEVNPEGVLYGTLDGAPLVGLWDEAAHQVTFALIRPASEPARVHLFMGYLVQTGEGRQGAGPATSTLTGTVTTLASPGTVPSRPQSGWSAQPGGGE